LLAEQSVARSSNGLDRSASELLAQVAHVKINRCMAEGRTRFLQVFAEIEAGQRCEELADALSLSGESGSRGCWDEHSRDSRFGRKAAIRFAWKAAASARY
jgi:hypothetical protein